MTDEFDTQGTDEMVCPHCGFEHRDSWELDPESEGGTYECTECGESFKWARNFEVTYYTFRPRPTPDAGE